MIFTIVEDKVRIGFSLRQSSRRGMFRVKEVYPNQKLVVCSVVRKKHQSLHIVQQTNKNVDLLKANIRFAKVDKTMC